MAGQCVPSCAGAEEGRSPALCCALTEVLGSKALGRLIPELTRGVTITSVPCSGQCPLPAPPVSVSNSVLTALTLGAECVPI